MDKKLNFALVLIFVFNALYGQVNKPYSVGLYFGFGNEFKNRDYKFTNQYYKLQLSYLIKDTKTFNTN